MKRSGFLLLMLLLSVWARSSWAQESVEDLSQDGDYDVDHKGWNGLSTFAALAEGSGLQVSQRTSIEWEELDSDDLVLLLYPTNFVDPSHIVSFIRQGGRVLIADDFGSGAPVFGQLGGRRSSDVAAEDYHDSQVYAPIAKPSGRHALSSGVEELTTNHPATIRNLEGMQSVFRFEGGASVVAAGGIGAGRYVVLSDPSVLINRMLQFEGNLQFSINLLRFLARKGESDRIVVLSGRVNFSGLPRNRYDDGTWRGAASVWVAEFDGWLDQLNSWLLTATSLRIITVLVAMLLAIWAFVVLPGKRKRPLDGSWTRSGRSNAERGYQNLIGRYESSGPRTSYLLPAAIERDNINTALELALQTPDPLYALSEKDLLARTREQVGEQPAYLLGLLLPRITSLPQRAQAATHWQPRFLGLSEFKSIHKEAERLFQSIDAVQDSAGENRS